MTVMKKAAWWMSAAGKMMMRTMNLKPCPYCGAAASLFSLGITCSKNGCRMVKANNVKDAALLWNAPRFPRA